MHTFDISSFTYLPRLVNVDKERPLFGAVHYEPRASAANDRRTKNARKVESLFNVQCNFLV